MEAGSLMYDAQRLAQALGLSDREARFEAQVLLMRTAGIDRARLIARPDLAEQAAASPAYRAALGRRLLGEPVAYILGAREFYGLELEVSPAVLIPRPETELLVEAALERIPGQTAVRVLDVGTGSGCIALALAVQRPHALVVATDISSDALDVARRNAARHRVVNLELRQGSVFEPVAGERFDLVVSNPPYIPAGDAHLGQGDLRFEPKHALTPGADGMSVLSQLIDGAPAVLSAGGWLLLEHGFDQAGTVAAALSGAGFDAVATLHDLGGQPRVSAGRLTLSP
jgi:release factor glutamine methyltransferase